MSKIITFIIVIILFSSSSLICTNAFEVNTIISDDLHSNFNQNKEPFDGYTLLNPWLGKKIYLINNIDKKVVHKWESNHRISLAAYLLENGNLIRTSAIYFNPYLWNGGCGGRVEIFDWDGKLIWDFIYVGETYSLHNDIEVLPNGNILMTVWESKTINEVIDYGYNPNNPVLNGRGFLLIDYIIEVKPTSLTTGDIVWEWHVWDHLIQDYDSTKKKFGIIADHPELLDINHDGKHVDLTHINSIFYNETNDQMLISSRSTSEIWVIDHSTTTGEAAGHSGGKYGKGGDILYRWGNPQIYNRGNENDKKLFAQHDARWIESGCPGEGHITIFNNGLLRPDGKYSSILEIIPPVDENGNYHIETNSSYPGFAYGPKEPVWEYTSENPIDFFSAFLSGAQRLPNGNTFICSGFSGHLFEVTNENDIVWNYINPYPIYIPFFNFPFFNFNRVFKTQCYSEDYPGLKDISTILKNNVLQSDNMVKEDN